MNARSLPFDRNAESIIQEATEGIRNDLAKIKKQIEQHDEARDNALREAVENGDFEQDPYSIYGPLTTFVHTCGCVATKGKGWDDSKCTEEM